MEHKNSIDILSEPDTGYGETGHREEEKDIFRVDAHSLV